MLFIQVMVFFGTFVFAGLVYFVICLIETIKRKIKGEKSQGEKEIDTFEKSLEDFNKLKEERFQILNEAYDEQDRRKKFDLLDEASYIKEKMSWCEEAMKQMRMH